MVDQTAPPSPNDQYRAQFPRDAGSAEASKAARAYAIALDIRKFEIELYWKRAAYFWVFTGAALAAYLAALTGKDIENRPQALLLASCIGLVFATAWYFVNRASKYWQSNWEFHVDLLEDDEVGPLYKTVLEADIRFLNLGGAYPFSVSKINQWLSLFVVAIFALLVFRTTLEYYTLTTEWKAFPTMCLVVTGTALLVLGFFAKVSDPQARVGSRLRSTSVVTRGNDG
jgi:hypothetical protein